MILSRLLKTMLTSLIILIVLFIGAIIFYFYQQNDTSIDTIDNIPSGKFEDYSYETSEITTNLKDGTFIRIQFQIIVNSKDRKSTRLNSSHVAISYAFFCL